MPILSSSFEVCWVEKNQKVELQFQGLTELIYYFDIKKCPLNSIYFIIGLDSIDFKDLYGHIVAKDISKEIEFVFCFFCELN